ncbi:carbohydrate ABC transporter permease [Microbacterium oryzae]|uniref:carbohydrate ABC transporter permease n=1 Tax=Microbacterium oryzae TaxID=743009 RepID=UPI0025AF4E38|nr:carbohydrate ABC transporter permease [Microbacterium oryzae]MDN3310984.1 carbohydrate ABC transporter permease [Microbacterium oryzae]
MSETRAVITSSGAHARGRFGSENRRASDLLLLIPLFAVLLMIVFPVLWMTYSSLRPARSIAAGLTWGSAFSELSFDSYERLFDGTGFGHYLVNSLLICLVGTLVTVVVAALAGFALSRYAFRIKKLVMLLLVATQLLPFVVLVTPVYLFFAELGLLNSYAGIVIVYVAMTLPLAVLLMTGFFNAVPRTLDEAARVDGASTLTVIARIIAPLTWPGIVTVSVTAFIAMWEEFLFAQVFLTDDALKTVQVGLAGLFGEYGTDWGVVMAASVVAALPTIILFSLLQRRLVAGVAAGAIKE